MKQYSRFITLAGGILALFSFVLPWESDYSGVELANNTSHNSDVGFVLIVFIATLMIIVTSLVLNRQSLIKVWISKFIVTVSSSIGIFCFILLFFGERWDIDIYGNYADEIQYGAFLNAIGFILAVVGVWDSPKTLDISETNNE